MEREPCLLNVRTSDSSNGQMIGCEIPRLAPPIDCHYHFNSGFLLPPPRFIITGGLFPVISRLGQKGQDEERMEKTRITTFRQGRAR